MITIFNVKEDKAVGALAEMIALQLRAPPAQAEQIRKAASLHDVGKRLIPERILYKPEPLTADELQTMKLHTLLGAKILKDMKGELGEMARTCCMYHHEWFNGKGYWGKRINELPFYVAYTAISDVFAALVCERPYKQAWSQEEALKHIHSKSGTQFDPVLVGVFLALVNSNANVTALFEGVDM